MRNGLAPVNAQAARVQARNPSPVARIKAPRRRQDVPGVATIVKATARPTGRKARVNIIPIARTRPANTAKAARPRPDQAASARAVVERNGKAVSATGWKRIAAGTRGQSAEAAQAVGGGKVARASP